MSDAPLSVGEAIAAGVARHGVDTIFGLPGAQTYALFDGFDRFGLRLIVPRHEQAAGYMAMGYARTSGRTGVCSVVPGPGLLNASAALCTAMGTCTPLVCLTGAVPSQFEGRGRGHLHELPDQAATFESFIKQVFHVSDTRRVGSYVNWAFQAAASGRPGPVVLQCPWDKIVAPALQTSVPAPLAALKPTIDDDRIGAAAALIASSRRPMIMCGAGSQDASEAVLELAERLDAPVTAFRSGRGVVAEDHELAAPPVAARLLWDDVDLLIGIGSRLEMPFMRWGDMMHFGPRPGRPKLLRIDIDEAEFDRLVPDVAVVGDAAEALACLLDDPRLSAFRPAAGRREAIAAANDQARRLFSRIQPQAGYLDVIRQVLPRDGFFVPELSQVGFTTYTGAFPVLAPHTYVTEGHQGTLGFGFPTALGVKVAHPDRAVVSVTGDGGFMFGLQELATAAEYRIGVTTIVFNNGSYANVVRDQQRGSGRVVGSRFTNPDFMKLADAFGVAGYRTDSPSGLQGLLERALSDDMPALIEVQIPEGSESSPWDLIHMPEKPTSPDQVP